MPEFLGAAGHAEGLMRAVERHDPLEKWAFSVILGGFPVFGCRIRSELELRRHMSQRRSILTTRRRADAHSNAPTSTYPPSDSILSREWLTASDESRYRPRAPTCLVASLRHY